MNKILIVEDNQKKLEKLKTFLEGDFPNIIIEERTSYNSASKEIVLNFDKYDLILLDMSMQTYDISDDESGGEPEPLAGKNILKQIYLRNIPTKVIVVTMYENYVDGTRIKELDQELSNDFGENYCGYIFFSHSNKEWSIKLKELMLKL
ncbi:response regulator [Flavobacterium selenitireducens]|uniref:response regulator n=1 Tax=Flavobacterium selenitireducens TaxID=2722704 RepID=UPI00168B730E|nr:response regulator [Flavobacterium selenitireducens]MBD3583600.1 response regulator [Flavobacterium selenitireducens]